MLISNFCAYGGVTWRLQMSRGRSHRLISVVYILPWCVEDFVSSLCLCLVSFPQCDMLDVNWASLVVCSTIHDAAVVGMSMMLCLVAVLEFSVVPVSKVLVSSQSTQVSSVTTGLCIGEACSSSMLHALWPMLGCIQILISFAQPGGEGVFVLLFRARTNV